MNIPTPDEFTKQGGFNPFPPRWEKWLSSVREAILTSQPTAGRHVSIDEHPGKGTVINVDRRPASISSCNIPVRPNTRLISATGSKYGFRNITSYCGGSLTGGRYVDVNFGCLPADGVTTGTPDSMLRFYLQADGHLSECTAAAIGAGSCFAHPSSGGDCGCGGTGTMSYTLLSGPSAGTTIDPSIGAGKADVTACSGAIHNGSHSYSCSDFDVNSLFDNSLASYGAGVTLSTEYTTAELIADTTATLPADFSGDFTLGEPYSQRTLSDDESNYEVIRGQYALVLDVPTPNDCTVKWRERTIAADGTTCLGDVFKSEVIPAGSQQTTLHELFEPPTNGTIIVVGDCCWYDGSSCDILDHSHCEDEFPFAGTWLAPSCATPCDDSDCA